MQDIFVTGYMERYRSVFGSVAEAIEARSAELSASDAASGDGDHAMSLIPNMRGAIDAKASLAGDDLSAVLDVVGKSLSRCEAVSRAGSTPHKGAARIPMDRNGAPFSSRRCNARSQVVSR